MLITDERTDGCYSSKRSSSKRGQGTAPLEELGNQYAREEPNLFGERFGFFSVRTTDTTGVGYWLLKCSSATSL